VIVLDTDVVSELLRPEPDSAVLAWLAAQRRGELYTTTISEGEIASGLALLPKNRRRDMLTQAVARLLGEGLGGRVLPGRSGLWRTHRQAQDHRRASRDRRRADRGNRKDAMRAAGRHS